jgi:hypothetical protein
MPLPINRHAGKFQIQLLKYIFLLVLTLSRFSAMGQKTDKLVLLNGDTLTGEILSMKLGMLTYKMDGPGTISIKWEYITLLKSNKVLEFTLRNGEIVVSTLDDLFSSHNLKSLDEIIEIIPIKDRFLKRLVGNVDLGFNYTKSNSILQSNFNSNISYIIPKREFTLKLNSVLTNYGNDTSLSTKQDIIGSFMRNLNKKYFWAASLGWQQNTELGLSSRYLLSGAFGLQPLTDNHNRLLAAAGFSYNQEQSVETGKFSGNFDALFMAAYKRFYYSTPKLSIDAAYTIYPGLSDWGRIRMQADLNVSVEIFKDFQTGLVFYYSYDNKPPQGSLSTNDYGIMFTIGYIFGK